jgi:uncharacterized membrane protein YgcG
MIADDLRATTVYQPQDTSAIAQLMSSAAQFDVDSIDEERPDSDDSDGGATGGGLSGAGSFGTSGGTSMGASSTSGSASTDQFSMPLGLSGTLDELYVDVTRLPAREDLFKTITGYTNAPSPMATGAIAPTSATAAAGLVTPSDLKTVRYFIRPGQQIAPSSIAATSLAPELQLDAGGLVRQEIPYNSRLFAEQVGDSAILESGQALIAPEVVHLEFRYFDGQQVVDVWDMREMQKLPLAIEVRIWLAPPDETGQRRVSPYDVAGLADWAHEYRQIVYLPMSEISNSSAGGGTGGGSSSSDSSSTDSSSSSSGGSGFGQP